MQQHLWGCQVPGFFLTQLHLESQKCHQVHENLLTESLYMCVFFRDVNAGSEMREGNKYSGNDRHMLLGQIQKWY